MSKSIILLHPFTAQSIGLKEQDILTFHSKPHEYALKKLKQDGFSVSIDYFTGSLFPFSKTVNSVKKKFWPISNMANRYKWLKEKSFLHELYYKINPPDLTIINVSGNGTNYVRKLAKHINKKHKRYIAMLGGVNVNTKPHNLRYFQEAHHLIVHTQFQKKELQEKFGFADNKIKVVPLGVNTNTFTPKQKNNDAIRLLFVGRITRLKQIELAIKGLNSIVNDLKINNVSLTIIGPISDMAYYKELQKLVMNLKLESLVRFLDALPQEELVLHYQEASILLMPSLHESFGMVAVEAMACGTPVLAFESAVGPSEIINNAKNGVLAKSNMFVEELVNLIKAPEKLKLLSQNARMRVCENYSQETTYKKLKQSVEFALA